MSGILELITLGAGIFASERKEYFKNRVRKLLEEIQDVADSDFYSKDLEAKGLAERKLILEVDELRKEFVLEAKR